MSPKKVRALFERLAAADPEPRSELEYGSPYQLLVAVILAAPATDKGVNRATRTLFPVAGTPQAMLALGEERLAAHVSSIGLYRAKAKHIIAMSRRLVEQHGGEVPATREALEGLPGVGRKTASVVLNTAFGQPVIAVDTHIFRVANRTGLAPGRNVGEVERRLMTVVPPEFRLHAHHWLILHGRYVCKARAPRCAQCLIRDLCAWPDKT